MVRNYRPDDLPVIMDIGNRAWCNIYRMFRETYGERLFQTLVPDPDTTKGEQVRAHAQAHPEWLFVSENDGRVVGFITVSLEVEKKIGVIGNNAVDPDCGLKGIGQQQYQVAFAYFRAQGMQFARVGTGLDWAHAPARRAYERAGFNIRHEQVTYYREL